ncbi:MAG: carboxypeptidase M32 [Aeoliella sp.]
MNSVGRLSLRERRLCAAVLLVSRRRSVYNGNLLGTPTVERKPDATMPDYHATYEKLCHHARKTALLSTAGSILDWDENTKMPTSAGPYRAEQATLMAGLVHARATSPQVGEWLAELVGSPLATEPHGDTGTVIRELNRAYDRKTKLPQRLVEELTRTSSLGQQTWVKARKENDFATFAPLLKRMMELKREEADAVGYGECRYDALLDEYEPHETSANVGRVLTALGEALTPLVEKINASSRKAPSEILARDFPAAAQEQFGMGAARAIGFDFGAGRLDVTAHPFCTTLGPRDIRLTTRYSEHEFNAGLFSILHEAGHGLYEQGLPAEEFGLPTGETISLGIHESQSRMWENLVGRDRAFWDHLYKPAQDAFPQALADVSLDDFYFAINESKPSLIRVEADEATYNLHILIRFELEKLLIDDDLPVDDLPTAWNARYKKYLGIIPPNDAEGVMQDVHWSCGLVGYFPTYALGNLYASQFFEQAQTDLGDLSAQFREGDFAPLLGWLRKNIHAHGQRFTATELVQQVTGSPLSSEALLRHLSGKFGELYGF